MALPFVGTAKTSVTSGLIAKIEVRQQGTGSFVDVGLFRNANVNAEAVASKGDPAGSSYAQYIRYSFSFDILQTGSAELSAIAGTAGTGLFETDVEVKFTYKTGRVLTFGAVTACPLRMVPGYKNDTDLQVIPCVGENIEPYTSLNGKVS